MKFKIILAIKFGLLILSATAAYAANQSSDVDYAVVGVCLVQNFKQRTPAVPQATILKCINVDDDRALPGCLGITDEEYNKMADFCVLQLVNAKCVSMKMKVSLLDYVNCGYEKDLSACFKKLGFSKDDVAKMRGDCQKEAAAQ